MGDLQFDYPFGVKRRRGIKRERPESQIKQEEKKGGSRIGVPP